MKKQRTVTSWVASAVVGSLLLAGCTAPQGSDAEISIGTGGVGDYNPLNGHGVDGSSPFYDGLLAPSEDSGKGTMPPLKPALAEADPEASDGNRTWTVRLRDGVKFSDGSTLTSEDVKATYSAVTNPKTASTVSDVYRMIKTIDTPDDRTVVFRLSEPMRAFPVRLTMGVLPASVVEQGKPAEDWKVTREPVGTGAYTLDSLESNTAVLKARDDYWGGKPELETVTYQAYDDTAAMAEAVKSGKVTGSSVPPRSADGMAGDDAKLVTARSADWRGLSMPSENPLTADPAVRMALNIGVDREAFIDNVFGGHGKVAYTPAGEFMGDAFDPGATFEKDREKAREMLDEAGWTEGQDGMRSKDGRAASLTILYPAGDALRADVAAELKEQLHELGIDVTPKGQDWDVILQRMDRDAVVYAGGEQPYDVDHQLRAPLHTRTDSSGAFDNPADVAVPGVDSVLDRAAAESDAGRSDALYRQAQELYVKQPSWLVLGFLDHTYIDKSQGWTAPAAAFEPHAHGSEWGPWWDLAAWKRD